jgi:hypothetical protein
MRSRDFARGTCKIGRPSNCDITADTIHCEGANIVKRKLALVKSSSFAPAKPGAKGLLTDLREMILSARQTVATTANATLTMLHWQIGNRIRKHILREKRAEYGEQILSTLSKTLEAEFGRGFGQRNLFRMVRFSEVFPDPKILTSLMTQLGWTHFLHIIRLDDSLKRDFYAEMCRIERWSTRTLDKKIGGMLFERTALSKKPAKLAAMELKKLREEDKLTPDLVFIGCEHPAPHYAGINECPGTMTNGSYRFATFKK